MSAISKFPNASESFKRLNGGASVPVPIKPTMLNLIVRPNTDEKKLNKTEAARLAHLRALKLPAIGIQNHTLKLADDCRFTPDFNYIDENGVLTFEDVKGFQREDALLKIKFAARTFTHFRFLIVKKDGRVGWEVTEVKL